jgi:hypothetical protein
MPVNQQHREYEKNKTQWKRIRDAVSGEDAVKDAGVEHLPRPAGQDNYDYKQYLKRAMYYGASGRTSQGLVGAIFRKDPTVETPAKLAEFMDNVTLTGLPFNNFAKMAVEEVITMGRGGILVDRPSGDAGRAYLRLYPAESIINWRTTEKDGSEVLEQIVLHEERQRADADGFGTEFYNVYRVLSYDETDGYTVRVFEEGEDDGETFFTEIEQYQPNRRGERFDYIPFVFLSPNDLTPPVDKSPLIDLVNVNLSHYRTQADLEQANYLTSSPTPYIIGQKNAEQANWSIGSGTIWFLSEGASTGMLEYTGGGLTYLEQSLDRKQGMMALLGARLLEESKRTAEAAETVRLRGSGESSILASIADTVSDGLKKALEWAAAWEGVSGDISIELNTDFMDAKLNPQELTALVQAWQAGAMGQADMLYNLQRGEMLRPDYDIGTIQDEIDAENGATSERNQADFDADDDDEQPQLALVGE